MISAHIEIVTKQNQRFRFGKIASGSFKAAELEGLVEVWTVMLNEFGEQANGAQVFLNATNDKKRATMTKHLGNHPLNSNEAKVAILQLIKQISK